MLWLASGPGMRGAIIRSSNEPHFFNSLVSISLNPIGEGATASIDSHSLKQVRSNKDASKVRMFQKIVLNCFKLF